MNTAGIEFIRNEMDWDKYDAWGSVQSARFDLAEAWWVATGDRLWDFESPNWVDFSSDRAERLSNAMSYGLVTEDDVLYWCRILGRMRDLVIAAGRDY